MRCEQPQCPVTFHVSCLLWFYCDQTLEKLPTESLYCLDHSEYCASRHVHDLQVESMLVNATRLTPAMLVDKVQLTTEELADEELMCENLKKKANGGVAKTGEKRGRPKKQDGDSLSPEKEKAVEKVKTDAGEFEVDKQSGIIT